MKHGGSRYKAGAAILLTGVAAPALLGGLTHSSASLQCIVHVGTHCCASSLLCAVAASVAPGQKKPPAKKPAAPATTAKAVKAPPVPAGMVPLIITTPPPPFLSGQLNVPPGAELPKNRGPFYVPRGTTNVARAKPVTSSDMMPIIGSLDLITDGVKEAQEGAWVEFGPGTQWVQIDLKQPYDIYGIMIWHHGEARVYYDVIVRVADDASFTANARTVFNNDPDNSSGFGAGQDREYLEFSDGKLIDTRGKDYKGIRARYVRLYSKGNTSDDMNQYTEVEVYGTPVK